MSPNRKVVINGRKIEEYVWAWKLVVYVDNELVKMTFEEACHAAKNDH